jgi:hypothetical protein
MCNGVCRWQLGRRWTARSSKLGTGRGIGCWASASRGHPPPVVRNRANELQRGPDSPLPLSSQVQSRFRFLWWWEVHRSGGGRGTLVLKLSRLVNLHRDTLASDLGAMHRSFDITRVFFNPELDHALKGQKSSYTCESLWPYEPCLTGQSRADGGGCGVGGLVGGYGDNTRSSTWG